MGHLNIAIFKMKTTYQEPILRTKLYKPIVKDDYVIRQSIIDQLENNRHNSLTLVVAATGYGKSVTVSQYLDQTSARYCWLSLDDEFNDVRTFFLYLVYAIRSVFPDALSILDDLLQGPELPPQKVLINFLINGLDETDQEIIIVLDDYQTIQNKQIHEIINGLLKNHPPKLQLIIISRRDPALNLSSPRTFRDINELRMSGLSFKQDEIIALAEKILHIPINEKIAALLLQKTEGWIVGLRMALVRMAKSKDLEKTIEELTIDQQYFRQYLLEEVLQQQPEPVRKLLLTASILDRFSRDLLEAILHDDEESHVYPEKESFDQLIRSILFVIPLDEEGQWYRFHHFFHDFLQNQLARLYDDQEIKKLYTNASNWFEVHNLIEEAIRYAVKAENYARVVDIIEQNRLLILMEEQWWVVKNWIQLIPENIVREHTILLLTKLFVCQDDHRLEEMIQIIQELEQRLLDQPDNKHLGELLSHKGYLNTWVFGNPGEAVKLLERSKSLFPDRGEIGMRREHQLAAARLMTGHKKKALQALRKEFSHPENPERFKAGMITASTVIHLLSGELKRAINSAHDYFFLRKGKESAYAMLWDEYLLANALYQCYELKKAENMFEKLINYKDVLYTAIVVDVLSGYSLSTFMLGDYEASEKGLKELDSYTGELGFENFLSVAQSCRARIHLLQGKNELALEWSKSYTKEPHISELQFFIEASALTKARIWIACGGNQMLQDAIDDLNELLIKLRNVHNDYQIVNIQVLLAMGYFKAGNIGMARKSITEALIISEKDDFISPFIEPGKIIAELLENLSIDKSHVKFAKKILRMLRTRPDYHESKPQNVSGQHVYPDLGNTLSVREKELLQLVADGLRNKEIAEKLYLSLPSIKKYLSNIYEKLDVHNRTGAISKAAAMGLLNPVKKNE